MARRNLDAVALCLSACLLRDLDIDMTLNIAALPNRLQTCMPLGTTPVPASSKPSCRHIKSMDYFKRAFACCATTQVPTYFDPPPAMPIELENKHDPT